jgi:hypothetical protein
MVGYGAVRSHTILNDYAPQPIYKTTFEYSGWYYENLLFEQDVKGGFFSGV